MSMLRNFVHICASMVWRGFWCDIFGSVLNFSNYLACAVFNTARAAKNLHNWPLWKPHLWVVRKSNGFTPQKSENSTPDDGTEVAKRTHGTKGCEQADTTVFWLARAFPACFTAVALHMRLFQWNKAKTILGSMSMSCWVCFADVAKFSFLSWNELFPCCLVLTLSWLTQHKLMSRLT